MTTASRPSLSIIKKRKGDKVQFLLCRNILDSTIEFLVAMFTNDLDAGIESLLSKFSDNMKLERITKILGDASKVQKALNRLEHCARANRIGTP